MISGDAAKGKKCDVDTLLVELGSVEEIEVSARAS
jgi:hypothetical protein